MPLDAVNFNKGSIPMSIRKIMNHRTLHGTLVLAASSLALGACSSSTTEAPGMVTAPFSCDTDPNRPTALFDATKALKTASDGKVDPTTVTINLVPNHWSAFWATPSIGLGVAKREIGCNADMSAAALKGDPMAVQKQIDMLNGLVTKKVSGIGLSCKDQTLDVAPISSAVAAGIPVITFDSDAAKGDAEPYYGGRTLYIGSLNAPAGKAAAAKVVDIVKTGNVLVISSTAKEANFQQRLDGFVAGLDGTGVTADTYLLGDAYAAFSAAEPDPTHPSMDINAFLADHMKTVLASDAPPSAVFATNGTYGPIVADAVIGANMVGKVHIVAFDLSADVQRHLRNKVIDIAVVQKSYFFGYLSAYILYGMAANGIDASMATLGPWMTGDLFDTGVDLVSPDTLDAYSKYQIECLGIPSL